MKRFSFVIVLLVASFATMKAQDAHFSKLMEALHKAYILEKELKYEEALTMFLEIGKETEALKTENERQCYITSQVLAINCYAKIKKYDEGKK